MEKRLRFIVLYIRQVELVILVEKFTNSIDFQELSSATHTNITTKVSYFVRKVDIAFLT